MKLTEQELREILQQKRVPTGARGSDCLTSDQFVRAALGEMTEKERRNVARHLVNCMDCTEEYQAVRALERWAIESQRELMTPPLSQPPDRTTGRLNWSGDSRESERAAGSRLARGNPIAAFVGLFWGPRMRPLAALTLLIAVAGGSFVVWRSITHREPPVSTERSGVSFKLTVEPPDNAILRDAPEVLSWSALEHALTYRVMLYDFQSTPIWESPRLTSTSVRLPDVIRQQLLGNQPYYWRVIAEDAIEQRQSELFQFTLATGRRQ